MTELMNDFYQRRLEEYNTIQEAAKVCDIHPEWIQETDTAYEFIHSELSLQQVNKLKRMGFIVEDFRDKHLKFTLYKQNHKFSKLITAMTMSFILVGIYLYVW